LVPISVLTLVLGLKFPGGSMSKPKSQHATGAKHPRVYTSNLCRDRYGLPGTWSAALVLPPPVAVPLYVLQSLRAFRASDLSCAGKGSRAAPCTLRGRPAQTRFTVPSISSPQAVSAIERRRFFALSWQHSHVSIIYSRCRRLCAGSLQAPGAPRAHPPVGQIRSATGLRLDLCSCVVQQTSSSRFLNAAPLRKDASPSSRSSL
jgi:hypothetical protein